MPGEYRLGQLLHLLLVIPESIDQLLPSRCFARLPTDDLPQSASQASNTAGSEPGRDDAEGDIAQKYHRQQHDRREKARPQIVAHLVISQQAQCTLKTEG